MREVPLTKSQNRLLDRLNSDMEMLSAQIRQAVTDMAAEAQLPPGTRFNWLEVMRNRKFLIKEDADAEQQQPDGGEVGGV